MPSEQSANASNERDENDGSEIADGSNYRVEDEPGSETADGSNYREEDAEGSEIADGSNYQVQDEPGSEIADGSNYRDTQSLASAYGKSAACACASTLEDDIARASRPDCTEPEPLRRVKGGEAKAMGTIVVRFPDGSREHRYTGRDVVEGDRAWHDGEHWRVLAVVSNERGQQTATVELDSDELTDLLQ